MTRPEQRKELKALLMTTSIISRQRFLRHATALAVAPLLLQACSPGTGEDSYEAAVRATWRPEAGAVGEGLALRRELVRYATLAPSSHNTQCWKFRIEEKAILVLPDFSRRTPAVDPDDHHLFVSLGCAVENLAQAALAHGLQASALFNPAIAGGEGGTVTSGIQVALEPTAAVASALYRAIPERQNTRAMFDGQPVSNADLQLLNLAGTGEGVRVILHTEKTAMEKILASVVEGNSAQMNDAAFVAELKEWIRFSGAEAVRTGDGLYSATSGNPSVPRWLASPLFGMFFTEKNENDKYAQQISSSAGIAVFVSDANDKVHWVEAGRCYERFALQATALGIRSAMLNQPVEVPALRPRFADAMGIAGGRPDLVVRFGRGPAMPRSLRRPVQAVMV